ncbi:MAG: alpha/beta fold hydrolase [Planctomycetota bacterium]
MASPRILVAAHGRRSPSAPSGPGRQPLLAGTLLAAATAGAAIAQATEVPATKLELREVLDRASGERVRVGELTVPEDRAHPRRRALHLRVVVVPARAAEPRPDPIYFLAGGPGQAATTMVAMFARSWMREERDIVLVDQRGTGRSNPLRVDTPGSADDPAGYLEWMFAPEPFRAALSQLETHADLRCYTTEIAMDDLDAVRQALGHTQINLMGGSYGTRAALVYMRRHREHVRAAVLDGVAPIAFENPLHHARSAQDGFETLVAECEADPRSKAAYPDLRGDLATVLERLDREPATVDIARGEGEPPLRVRLTRAVFADALRVLLYYVGGNRRVPLLLHQAAAGDLAPFASVALQSNRRLSEALAFGMLMCVTAAEDLPRIDEAEIERECKGTFLGDTRVRAQLSIAAFWPRGAVSPGYGEPVRVDVPTLLLSGTHDPVTPPRWGAEAASHLPNSLHIVVAGCHGVGGVPQVAEVVRAFLTEGSVQGLDCSGLDTVRMPGILLPDGSRAGER